MKRFSILVLALGLLASGCVLSPNAAVYQTSTIDALLAGVYDGETTFRKLLENGDFGIGTIDHLDGEIVVLDGEVYQIKSDGKVYRPDLSVKTPFATVCKFHADGAFSIELGTDFDSVEKLIDEKYPNQNLFHAIKIAGKFKAIKTRSVPRQEKPYPSLKVATSHQPEFEMENISGTIVGFRCPAYTKGINVPGYHLHFISSDKTRGGHVLGLTIEEAECEVDVLDRWTLQLPADNQNFSETDLSKDRSKDLHAVEKR
ncbi:MAG: acetolactate decarboxylase [Candidatus Lindowbacteria bacterium]|nr:acetolactate decarboxylase [Candidatus Lindowbacteria bacterium]